MAQAAENTSSERRLPMHSPVCGRPTRVQAEQDDRRVTPVLI
jgi:hypothetical protein